MEAFNSVACEFLDDLSSTFDEHECLKIAHDSFNKMLDQNKSTPLPVCLFQSLMGGIDAATIRDRDPVLLEGVEKVVKSLGLGIDVQSEYAASDAKTKDAIWQYINSLHAMGRTLSDEGVADVVSLESVESVMASAASISPDNADAMMNSIMCLVPPALKDLVDNKVQECQQQLENGNISTADIMDQMKDSMSQFT